MRKVGRLAIAAGLESPLATLPVHAPGGLVYQTFCTKCGTESVRNESPSSSPPPLFFHTPLPPKSRLCLPAPCHARVGIQVIFTHSPAQSLLLLLLLLWPLSRSLLPDPADRLGLPEPELPGVHITCSVCRRLIKQRTTFCITCGHGGHPQCVESWCQISEFCATGCGCKCHS